MAPDFALPARLIAQYYVARRTKASPKASPKHNNSRKDEIRREGYQLDRTFTDPDPHKSPLCYACKQFIQSLHSHPWTDQSMAHLPLGETHHTDPIASQRIQWQHVDLQKLTLCALCQMIQEILVAGVCGNDKELANTSHLEYTLKPAQIGDAYDLDPRRPFGHSTSKAMERHARWCLSIEVRERLRQTVIHHKLPNAIRCATRPLPMPSYTSREGLPFIHRPILHGRTRELECSMELLKMWPHMCELHHGAECAQTHSRRGGIRLIDTKDQCIVSNRLFNFGPRDYVALSYVWGNKEQSYAPTAEAYSALYKKGALSKMKLSRTISDAILLVQRLGFRYLWADALCIQQDDISDKHEQIAQMGFVYQSALFTIIAAAGDDCDAGLPGLRPGTRFKQQKAVQAGDMTLVNSVQHPGDQILTARSSKWARRGWTLQEELLSARQLIFTDEQVWWRCPCATWCEESQLESADPVGFLLTGQTVMPRLEQRFSKLEPGQFFEIAVNYAQRQLSYPSDALHAFSGVLSMLTDYSNEQFLWGLMTSTFEQQLYWFGKAKKRPLAQEGDFPTWSWIGWEGEVSFNHYLTYKPLPICYMIDEDEDGYTCARVSNSSSISDRILEPLQDAQRVVYMEDVRAAHPIHSLKPGFHLFMYTYSAMFYLMPQGRLILPNQAPRYSYDPKGRLLGSKPDYGYLVPSLDGTELCEKGYRECILLGRRTAASVWDVPHVVVMLIARESGIAYRLGIADMPEEFWDMADKTWELVTLG